MSEERMSEPMAEDAVKPRSYLVNRKAASLRQSVIENIRAAIALGHYQPGQRLPERDLCQLTGVSRTLVREALRQLETEGLISVIPHRGPFVARITPKDAQDIYQVRAELEGLASELFAQKASDAQLRAVRQAFEDLKAAYGQTEPLGRLEAKNRFYECLIKGSGNEALGSSLQLLNSRIMLLRATSLQAEGRLQDSLAELEELMEALSRREPERARAASVKHVRNAAGAAIKLLADKHTDAPP